MGGMIIENKKERDMAIVQNDLPVP